MPLFLSFAESIQLVPDGTLFIHIAIILLMVFVLNRTLFKPVNRMLEERERRTHGRSDEARKTTEQVEESLRQYERSLREARVESYHTMERQRTEALGERQRRMAVVRDEMGGKVEEEKKAIRDQSAEARATLESEARRVAASVSTQILGRSVGGTP
jgi:F-type H+-transporting ATPase subunit b